MVRVDRYIVTFQDERFTTALANCKGSLKYKALTGKI